MTYRPKYLPNKVYLTLPGTGDRKVKVPVRAKPLKRPLSFFRSKADVEKGVQGECGTCANAIGAARNGLADIVQFTDSRVYLVDKFNKFGVPTECTVGVHGQGKFQDKFDRNKKALLKSEECEGIVVIKPLYANHQNKSKNKPTGPHLPPGEKQKKRDIGAAARAKRAGVIVADPREAT